MNMDIKIISFDIGGTLIGEHNNLYNLNNLSDLLKLPYENVRKVYKDIFQKTKGELNTLTNNFCTKLGIEPTEELKKFFENKFRNSENSTISDNTIALLKKIKEKGYKVILFSNSCSLIKNDIIDNIKYLVDDIFYSYDIGYTKNEDESYRIIESKMNALPNEFLHIGDNLKSDYLMPIKNGWNALLYGKQQNNVKTIQNLNEILDILNMNHCQKIKK